MKWRKNRSKALWILVIIIFTVILSSGCVYTVEESVVDIINPKQAMRDLVIAISSHAKDTHPEFMVIPQNGLGILEGDQEAVNAYLEAIDAIGQESLYYGYEGDGEPTPKEETDFLEAYIQQVIEAGKEVYLIHYTNNLEQMRIAEERSQLLGAKNFFAERCLASIEPDLGHQDFLYVINPQEEGFNFIEQFEAINIPLLIVDIYDGMGNLLTEEMINQLKRNKDGSQRKVVAYMSIGEAEDYRPYWENNWYEKAPSWLMDLNPMWEGNYKVAYWDLAWHDIIVNDEDSYLNKILDRGYDGVYLDIIDAYEYFE